MHGTDLACWIRAIAAVATMFPNEQKNKNSRKRKSRLKILMAAATFVRFEWETDAPVGARINLDGIGYGSSCSLPTFRVKLDIFHLSKLI